MEAVPLAGRTFEMHMLVAHMNDELDLPKCGPVEGCRPPPPPPPIRSVPPACRRCCLCAPGACAVSLFCDLAHGQTGRRRVLDGPEVRACPVFRCQCTPLPFVCHPPPPPTHTHTCMWPRAELIRWPWTCMKL